MLATLVGVGVEADQQVEALGQEDVGQHGAAEEQRHADDHEGDAVAPLLLVQAGGDEAPQVVQPHRAGR